MAGHNCSQMANDYVKVRKRRVELWSVRLDTQHAFT